MASVNRFLRRVFLNYLYTEMNIMAKKKITRKELLKKPDEFMTLSNRVVLFARSNIRPLKYIGLAVAIIVVSFFAIYTYFGFINEKGQNAYNTAYDTMTENMKPNPDTAKLQESEKLFSKVINEYGLSKAARLAIPQVAHLQFLEKKYAEAIVLYRKFLDEVSGNAQYESLANLALAICYEAKGDLKTAIETLGPIVNTTNNPFKETGMLNLARLYRLDNRPEKEKEILEIFIEEHKNSPFLPMAKAHIQKTT